MATLSKDPLARYPELLTAALRQEADFFSPQPIYVAGGTVRDWLLGRPVNDLDITVPAGGVDCARRFAKMLGGAFVLLDRENDVARVVWQGMTIDFSGFRENTETIEADLLHRDFTINSMAVALSPTGPGLAAGLEIIDPGTGFVDLEHRRIRATHNGVFHNDPLRMLRAYRFSAALDFVIDSSTHQAILENNSLLSQVSPERLAGELNLIMESGRASATFAAMKKTGILARLFPELVAGIGVSQPSSHHLDVFSHGMAAFAAIEDILDRPGVFFPEYGAKISRYLQDEKRRLWLKWAALFHDIGKTEVRKILPEKGERITFYNHDRAGARRFMRIARRLKWSRRDEAAVVRFIELHMYPFHLSNSRRRTGLSPRAYLRFVKAAGSEMEGLFVLAMADSLASQGPQRPVDMEKNLASLYVETCRVVDERIAQVLAHPRLVTGHDLLAMGIAAGPFFTEIFAALEDARVEGEVADRAQALEWVAAFVSRMRSPKIPGDK